MFVKGSYACSKNDSMVFKCVSTESDRCFNTDPTEDLEESVWKTMRYKPSVVTPSEMPTIRGKLYDSKTLYRHGDIVCYTE